MKTAGNFLIIKKIERSGKIKAKSADPKFEPKTPEPTLGVGSTRFLADRTVADPVS